MEATAKPTLPPLVEAYLLTNGYKYDPVDGFVQFVSAEKTTCVTFSHMQMLVRRFEKPDNGENGYWKMHYRVMNSQTWHRCGWSMKTWAMQLHIAGVIEMPAIINRQIKIVTA